MTDIFIRGNANGGIRDIGAIGVNINAERFSFKIEEPSENACPVEPVGVEMINPSIFCFNLYESKYISK